MSENESKEEESVEEKLVWLLDNNNINFNNEVL